MDAHFNFNSAICTSREQSERLLALGLKPETADLCYLWRWESDSHFLYANSWKDIHSSKSDIPAWSLHRLIEMKKPNKKENTFVVLSREQTYDKLIGMIAKSIKGGNFPKEYLV